MLHSEFWEPYHQNLFGCQFKVKVVGNARPILKFRMYYFFICRELLLIPLFIIVYCTILLNSDLDGCALGKGFIL